MNLQTHIIDETGLDLADSDYARILGQPPKLTPGRLAETARDVVVDLLGRPDGVADADLAKPEQALDQLARCQGSQASAAARTSGGTTAAGNAASG